MRKIDLTREELITLKECQKHHTKHNVRNRSMALLLLNKGRTIPQISKIIDVRTRTIYTWLDNWELKGITALMTRKGQGLKSKDSLTIFAKQEFMD
jgi:transposase